MRSRYLFLLSVCVITSVSCNLLAQTIKPTGVAEVVSATLTAEPVISPELAIPAVPTQTEPPPQLILENRHPPELRVAFISPDRNLYAWAQSTGLVKLHEFGDLSDLKLSEDGTLIAFTRQDVNQTSSLWIVEFDGSNPHKVLSWKDLISLKVNPDSLGTSPANLQWIPGTHTLTFTTRELFEGPGMLLNNDLVAFDADSGSWNIRLMPGQGGTATYSPIGQWMAISTAEKVILMDTNGNPAPGQPLSFNPVMTYSEYQYYPVPVWGIEGNRLAVFIPAADPLSEPRQPASIWTMDVRGGNPILQVQVTPQFIGPVTISPDLTKFFYVKEVGQPAENRREIRTASIIGQGDAVVFTGGTPVTWDWNPDNAVFAYQTSQEDPVTVSQMNGSLGNIPGTERIYWFKWVDATSYLFSRVNGNTVELFFSNGKEGNQLLAALPVSDYFRLLVDFTR